MKKMLLAATLSVFMVLYGCGSAASSAKTGETKQEAETSANETLVSETEPETVPHTVNSEEASAAEAETEAIVKDGITFSGLTAIDNDECSITLNEIDADNMWGYTIKATLENKSSDTTYMFAVETAAVNGVQVDPLFATEVAPGKKSNNDIVFPNMEKSGITEFTDIELFFRVYDTNDWTADAVANESVHVYPYGEEKASAFVRERKDTDNVLVDDDNVTAIVTDIYEDEIWGYTLGLYLENKTDTEVMFSVDEASVNGYMADPFYAASVKPGKCTFSSMSWADEALEENGIETVEEIEFLLRVYDNEDWTGSDLVNEKFTINP